MKNEAFLYNLPKKEPEKPKVIDTESKDDIANTFIPKLSEKEGIAPDLKAELETRAKNIEHETFLAKTREHLKRILAEAHAKEAEEHNARVIKGELNTPTLPEEALHDPWSDPGYRGGSRRD